MGLRSTQVDEKRLGPAATLNLTAPPPLSSRSEAELQFYGPFVEMFLDRAQRSEELCGFSSDLNNTHRHPAINHHILPRDEVIFHQHRDQLRNILGPAFHM